VNGLNQNDPKETNPELRATAVVKTFPAAPAGDTAFKLGPVDLDLAAGTCLAVIGPNGSGKSTLFQILTGNVRASSGSVTLAGHPVAAIRKDFGYLPQHNLLPPWATPRELCLYAAGMLTGDTRHAENALTYWDCLDFARRPVGMLSAGMRKRVGLAVATLHDPRVLVMDEPFEALDLGHIAALRQEIQRRTESGRITIFATHIAGYAADLATAAFFLHNGSGHMMNWPATRREREEILESRFAQVAPPPRSFLHPAGVP